MTIGDGNAPIFSAILNLQSSISITNHQSAIQSPLTNLNRQSAIADSSIVNRHSAIVNEVMSRAVYIVPVIVGTLSAWSG
jgi:hypothetical protein